MAITTLPRTGLEQFQGLLGKARGLIGDNISMIPLLGTADALNRVQQGVRGGDYKGAVSAVADVLPVGRVATGLIGAATKGKASGLIGDALNVARPKTQYEENMALAQQRAALPVEQGGLGLAPDNTPMDRAKSIGFNVSRVSSRQPLSEAPLTIYYHATDRDIKSFPEVSTGYNSSTFTEPTQVQRYANFVTPDFDFADNFASQYEKGANVMPLVLRINKDIDLSGGINPEQALEMGLPRTAKYMNSTNTWQLFDNEVGKNVKKSLKEKGYDSAYLTEENPTNGDYKESIAVLDPSRIRSRFAAFDPFRRNEADLLAFNGTMGGSGLLNINPLLGLLGNQE